MQTCRQEPIASDHSTASESGRIHEALTSFRGRYTVNLNRYNTAANRIVHIVDSNAFLQGAIHGQDVLVMYSQTVPCLTIGIKCGRKLAK